MKKKKFLWVLPYYPFPAFSGGNVRIYNLIKYLSEYYDIYLLSYYDGNIKEEYVDALSGFCKRVTVIERKQYECDLPLIFRYYTSPEMTEALNEHLKEDYDFIQIDFLTMAYYVFMIKELTDAPVFLTEHDVSSFEFDRCFHNRHLDEKERYIEWLKMHKVMDRIYPSFDAAFTVSDRDAEILSQKYPSLKVFAAPTGTDCSFYAFKENNKPIDSIVYVGHYLHYPNVDSVNYILEEVMPVSAPGLKDIIFYIVGSDGDKVFKEMARPDVRVTGTVPDLREYLYLPSVFVAPIRLGIGIRGKMLEAMSCGMPVITTSLGSRGIGAEDRKQLLVAENPEEFAEGISNIRNNDGLRKYLVKNASEFVREKYDWPVMVKRLVSAYESILE